MERVRLHVVPERKLPKPTGPRVAHVATIAKADLEQFRQGPGGYIALYVAACFDYTFPSDKGARHQTSCLLQLDRISGPPISVNDAVTDMNDLQLMETSIGAMDRAD